MNEQKEKRCKPNYRANEVDGCNGIAYKFTYGLCPICLYYWMTTTERGKIYNSKMFSPKVKKAIEKTKREKKKTLNVSGAMKLADTYFSRFIRLAHSKDGLCTCYTCGTIKEIKEVDNGHYLKREHKATRYHENNCRPQCKTCNGDVKHNGKQAEFRVNLSYEIGDDEVIELERLARTTIKANYLFFKELSDYYRIKVNEIQRKLKVKYW